AARHARTRTGVRALALPTGVVALRASSAAGGSVLRHSLDGATERTNDDLGDIPLVPVLLVLTGLDLSLDVNEVALLHVLLGEVRRLLVIEHHVVPLCPLHALPGLLVLPGLR